MEFFRATNFPREMRGNESCSMRKASTFRVELNLNKFTDTPVEVREERKEKSVVGWVDIVDSGKCSTLSLHILHGILNNKQSHQARPPRLSLNLYSFNFFFLEQ